MPSYPLIEEARLGNREAKSKFVEDNLGLVHSVARRFSGRGVDYDDLFQIGTLGLLKAIDRFDISLGYRFSTYAIPLIIGEMKRFFRDDGCMKVARNIKEAAQKIVLHKSRLFILLEREPTIQELSHHTGFTVETVLLSLDALKPQISFEDVAFEQDGQVVLIKDTIKDTSEDQSKIDEYLSLKMEITALTKKEKDLIYLRYYKDFTQTHTAKILSMTQVQVSRLEKKILQRLKQNLSHVDFLIDDRTIERKRA